MPSPKAESWFVRRTMAGAAPEVALTYLCEPITPTSSRLLVKVLVKFPAHPTRHLLRPTLPWLDLFMMRRQLSSNQIGNQWQRGLGVNVLRIWKIESCR